MDQFYIGYGHASIGDCGSTTIFIENISMLAAKAIQDNPLYSGQESSTRYIDFSKQPITDPCNRKEIQDKWMDFYTRSSKPLVDHLLQVYPIKAGEDPKQYERAINARSFDILRGFIPAGATTNVAWHTNLRQASDKLSWMQQHPQQEVRKIAFEIFKTLKEKYPNSFVKDKPEIAAWKKATLEDYNYKDYRIVTKPDKVIVDFKQVHLPKTQYNSFKKILTDRPKGAVLPHTLSKYGYIRSSFVIDYGSFRDLQRHRNGIISMPLLTTIQGMHPWYLDQLPPKLKVEATDLLKEQLPAIRSIPNKVEAQNYIPMGYMVHINIHQSIPAFVYRVELRTSTTVHPTLRMVTQKEALAYRKKFPNHALHVNMMEDDWDIRRGKQTILEN
jgi:thymidylate synthase ThyX